MLLISKYKYIFSGIILLGLLGSVYYFYKANQASIKKWKQATINVKAYASELDSIQSQKRVFQFTVSQLRQLNDSILKKMDQTRKEVKIKDSKILSMQYILSQGKKSDTVRLRDTIFKDPSFNLDTILQDKWYKTRLELKYPNTITVTTSFTSEKYIFTSQKKETINPSKKFFLWRWFQKKQIVLIVEVVEKSPYIINKQQRFVEIIK